MKLIITEEQLKLIIESENEDNLFNIPGEILEEEDGLSRALNLYYKKKEKRGLDGISFMGNLNFDIIESNNDDITKLTNELVEIDGYLNGKKHLSIELPKLKIVNGYVNLSESGITELPKLKRVEGNLDLSKSNIDSLPKLEYVGGILSLRQTEIGDLPKLKYVGESLNLMGTPLSEKIFDMNEDERIEMVKKINVQGKTLL